LRTCRRVSSKRPMQCAFDVARLNIRTAQSRPGWGDAFPEQGFGAHEDRNKPACLCLHPAIDRHPRRYGNDEGHQGFYPLNRLKSVAPGDCRGISKRNSHETIWRGKTRFSPSKIAWGPESSIVKMGMRFLHSLGRKRTVIWLSVRVRCHQGK